jgi:hypothetical protein
MFILDLTQHCECTKGHLVAIKFKQFRKKLANFVTFLIPSNLMCYIWVNLRTRGVYVNTNHNIITYITKIRQYTMPV